MLKDKTCYNHGNNYIWHETRAIHLPKPINEVATFTEVQESNDSTKCYVYMELSEQYDCDKMCATPYGRSH
jgi:hypothetical protein